MMSVVQMEKAHLFDANELEMGEIQNKRRNIYKAVRFKKDYLIQKINLQTHDDKLYFIKEEEMMHRLLHPAIIDVNGLSLNGDGPMIIFGCHKPLSSFLRQDKSEWPVNLRIMTIFGIASGIQFLLSKRMRIGALDADTMYIDQYMHPKLTNFGIFDFDTEDFINYTEEELVFQFGRLVTQVLSGKIIEIINVEMFMESYPELKELIMKCIGGKAKRPKLKEICEVILEKYDSNNDLMIYSEMTKSMGSYVINDYTKLDDSERETIKKSLNSKESFESTLIILTSGRKIEPNPIAALYFTTHENIKNFIQYSKEKQYWMQFMHYNPPKWYIEEVLMNLTKRTNIKIFPNQIYSIKDKRIAEDMLSNCDAAEYLAIYDKYTAVKEATKTDEEQKSSIGSLVSVIMMSYKLSLNYVDFDEIPETGIIYLKKAAKLNDKTALLLLGKEFKEGKLLPVDFVKSEKYLKLAEENGSEEAREHLKELYQIKEEIQTKIDEMPFESNEHFQKALDGDILECLYVGCAFLFGL